MFGRHKKMSLFLQILVGCFIDLSVSVHHSSRPCSILTCDNVTSKVFLSFNLRTDGIGATMHHLLNAGAYAHKRGILILFFLLFIF